MMPLELAARPASTVTWGLMNGTTGAARLHAFSPFAADLVLAPEGAVRRRVQAEHLAFLGFHRAPGEPAPVLDDELTRLHVTVAGGAAFTVAAKAADLWHKLGFYAHPADQDAPYREIFFYAHGVVAREQAELIGGMLVREGLVSQEGLANGLKGLAHPPLGQVLVQQGKVSPDAVESALELQQRRRLRLGEVLVQEGLVTAADVAAALAEQQRHKGKRLGEVLVEMNLLGEEDLVRVLARKFFLPLVDLDQHQVNPAAGREVPFRLVEKYGFLPADTTTSTFTIVISDPLNTEVHDVLSFHLRKRVCELLATPTQLRRHVDRYLASAPPAGDGPRLVSASPPEPDGDEAAESCEITESDSATVTLVNQILTDACRRGASDVHIEPNGRERDLAIRFRIDGDCELYQAVPPPYRSSLVARLKVMARLDLAERRKPQDGKIRLRLGDRTVELRVATIPTVNGNEDVVLRLLAGSRPMPLEKMGLTPRNLRELRRLIAKPHGLVLCVGPTGSGKTTTLHSALGAINTADRKIWTAEDPVEITQPGLRQVQVNPVAGLTFAAAMRAFLRADPDVIMIGEMRDPETAAVAIEASLTGHLVLSTLHTNSAPETLTRLLDMGLDPFTFADGLLGVVAQRLARALCSSCRAPEPADGAARAELHAVLGDDASELLGGEIVLWRGHGCTQCGGTGYRGRVALHELLVASEAIQQLVQRRAPADELRRVAVAEGMTTLLRDGVEKALAGQTDLAQVLAVCGR